MASEDAVTATGQGPIVLTESPVDSVPKQDRRMSDEWGELACSL